MDKNFAIRLRKRKLTAKITEELSSKKPIGNEIMTTSKGVSSTTRPPPLHLSHPVIRHYKPRKQMPSSTSTLATFNSNQDNTQQACDFHLIRYQILDNGQKATVSNDPLIGNFDMQEITGSNLKIFDELGETTSDIPIVTVSEACFNSITALNGTPIEERDDQIIKIDEDVPADDTNKINETGDSSLVAKMNELLAKLEVFLGNREKEESKDHEYAFGRAIAVMLKNIPDVDRRLKIETNIFGIICDELKSKS